MTQDRKVLLVDDDPLSLKSMERELAGSVQVLLAGGYSESVDILAQTDLMTAVIADLDLGYGPDGLALMRYVSQRYSCCRRIIVSGTVDDDAELRRLLATGLVDGVLTKPWKRGALLSLLK